jgi:hypothetical protein
LVVRAVKQHLIYAEIVNGTHARDSAFVPRILMSPSEDLSLPFKFKRKRFPVHLSFVMTINKAQGQTLPTIGVYLPEPMLSHGNYMLLRQRACLDIPPGFYVNSARKSIPKAIALGILFILTSLELDAFYISFDVLFANRLVIFKFIEL